ncbi:hypothetical protein L6164_033961 [Bauhinia variegata]|uniref:Uncharacterized protein n=1 Tax=Bauhinia variegata TaxID=167791 RepID=A0ACB9KTX7_BAUVA|nr:hypothetical protein L6164_033961 [Bauhinia variegata]
MEKDQPISVKDAVYKIQVALLEGIKNEDQLFVAGSLMSRSDYEDVVTERSITNVCGYPLCCNPLPSDRPRKGRYRISLKEHKVYDLHETYMYCSSSCVVDSKAFSGSLQDERCSALDPKRLNEVLRLFSNVRLEPEEKLVKKVDLGLSGLKIQEKKETSTGEVSLEEWTGPSNAIEGYVPKKRDSGSKGSSGKSLKKGSKASSGKLSSQKNSILNEMDFVSTIITQDEYSVSKLPSGQTETTSDNKIEPTAEVDIKNLDDRIVNRDSSVVSVETDSERILKQPKDDHGIQQLCTSFTSSINLRTSKADEETRVKEAGNSSSETSDKKKVQHSVARSQRQCHAERNDSETKSIQLKGEQSRIATNSEASASNLDARNAEEKSQVEKATKSSKTKPKSSLKSAGKKKLSRSVTWADEKIDSSGSKSLCEFRDMGDIKKESDMLGNTDDADDEDILRRASAEACAIALTQASEAVESGEAEVTDCVSDAGIIILPPPQDVEEGTVDDVDILETDSVTLKWPRKPGFPNVDLFDSEDSWYDPPPEGFSLTLSPFATMWNALFSWLTSSSLAYIYGRDESFHEEYLSINGREYPRKIVLADGRSSEIKQTLAGCLARALPGVVADLRLAIPVSNLEQGMARLLETMSFMDALPALKIRQWQVVVLLFLDALSVSRIPALISYMTERRMLFQKVLDGTQIGIEEYEVLKDLIIPLGRAPHFSAQSGA